jgi:trehalose/maltose hydrolase-like predicted phosphorylase
VRGVYNSETTILGGLPVLNEDLVNLPNWLVLKLRNEGEDAIRLTPIRVAVGSEVRELCPGEHFTFALAREPSGMQQVHG